jgi:hypothetical protein
MKMICKGHENCLVCKGCFHSNPHDEASGCRNPPNLCIGCQELYASHSDVVDADTVLNKIEKIISDRIIELKSWKKIAEINQDRKRVLEILPILGENTAIWAQIQELKESLHKRKKQP